MLSTSTTSSGRRPSSGNASSTNLTRTRSASYSQLSSSSNIITSSSSPITQCGVISVGDNKNAKNCIHVNVVFPKPFSKQPIVHGQTMVDPHGFSSSSSSSTLIKEVSNTFSVTILSTTTTGFCCIIKRVCKLQQKGWNNNVKLQWFATLPSFCSGRTVVGIPSSPIHNNSNNNNLYSNQSIGSISESIMVSTTSTGLPTGLSTSVGVGGTMSSNANNSSLVYLMSVTINLPPIPPSWNINNSNNIMVQNNNRYSIQSPNLYKSAFSGSDNQQQAYSNFEISAPESPTVSTSLMYSMNSSTTNLISQQPPIVIVTPHASDGNLEESFVASVREIYPNRFVAVVRKVSNDNSKTWSQPVKLNWTVFYNSNQIPSPFGKDCIIKAGVLPIGQNVTTDDVVDREIRFISSNDESYMPRVVICTPRCDPQIPNNDIHLMSLKTISPYGFSINVRNIDNRTWHQNLYISYFAIYKKKIKNEKNNNNIKIINNNSKKSKNNNLVVYNTQLFIKNCTSGFVLEAKPHENSVIVNSEKTFLLSQDQRFIFRESGFIELSSNSNYVLEVLSLDEDAPIVISEKRDENNATQKWLVFQPVCPISSDSVCIANVGNLNLVLDCDILAQGGQPFVSKLNMTLNNNEKKDESIDASLKIRDKSKTQQWKFTTVTEE
ncbi:hypothetical protein ABK040_006739 [Willaertia magna]